MPGISRLPAVIVPLLVIGLAPIARVPVIVPPAFGSAALAVVVVEVKIASRVAISTPSTVPPTVIFVVTSSTLNVSIIVL